MPKNQKILVVEDYDQSRELLVLYIRRLGYEVLEATNGTQALEQAAAMNPDLILMDLSMPIFSGQEATACLKADPATRDIPVLVTTEYIDSAQTKSALESGALEVLLKPLNFVALGEVLGRYLRQKRENDDRSLNQPRRPEYS